MKKLMMMLAIIGMIQTSANAQKTSKFAKNYDVCRYRNGYEVCSKDQMSAQNKKLKATKSLAAKEATPLQDQVVYVKCFSAADQTPAIGNLNYRRHNNMMIIDDMDNPYHGLPSRQYDGPVKNEERNKNVNQTSIDLPANDGSFTAR